ncbi:hypothetical protein BREVNS_1763 [Brevinematales bacterium NS]|nr:hypothetical protein BREVNS_1763 [Brevinematales bacterium NS]
MSPTEEGLSLKKEEVFLYPQKRPTIRPRRIRSMRRGQRAFVPRGSASWKKEEGQQKEPKTEREKMVEGVLSFWVKITVLSGCGTTLQA